MTSFLRTACVSALLLASACDNVGRVWDPVITPPAPGTAETIVQLVPEGGVVVDGRPQVRATFPKDGGWPTTVPVVVEFSESVNTTSIEPTSQTANDARIVLRLQGATQTLPVTYDWFANNRLLVMRPLTELSNTQTPTYEVVLQPDARDCDGVPFDVPTAGTVLTQFQVNQDASFHDGRIVTTYPRNNAHDLTREGQIIVVFDRPATPATVIADNLQVQPSGGLPLQGDLRLPLKPQSTDGRLAQFTPSSLLDASTQYELVVNASILFANDGKLDFSGRTPFARFETVRPRPPQAIALGNAITGFPDKVNIANIATVVINVTTPVDTEVGDRVQVRIYGGDKSTAATGDIAFIERIANATQAGLQTVAVDFAGKLGTTSNPKFDEGEMRFIAQMLRGSQSSGFAHQPSTAHPLLDVTPPQVVSVGPPASTDGHDVRTDLDQVAFYGVANEPLGAAQLTALGVAVPLAEFAFGDDGHFLMLPLTVHRLTAPAPYTLTVTDAAGNMTLTPFQGNIVQRGAITGALAGTLTIEAYDEATLAPIAGAKVIVDVGAPVLAPANQFVLGTTDGAGRVVYDNLTTTSHTITIVVAGYDLATIYDTQAAFVSLPLRPNNNATATLTGTTQQGQTPPGSTVLVSSSAVSSRNPLGVRTASATPNTIVPTAILPNRPQIVTTFGGTFEPTANPPFSAHAAPVLGTTFTTPTPPTAPAAGGAEATLTIPMIPSTGQTSALVPLTSWVLDFGLATGLDLGALVGGGPRARMTASLDGFEGQVLIGVGFVTSTSGTLFSLDGSYSVPIVAGLSPLGLKPWALAEAQDTSGRVSRARALFVPPGNTFPLGAPPPIAIPVITPPTGPATTAPAVTFEDVVDGSGFVLGTSDVTATDSAGRRWVVYVPDRDAPGGPASVVQFPDLGIAGEPGLALGAWTLVVESRVWTTLTGCTADDCMLTERVRTEVLYARSASEVFTVQ